MLRLIPVLAGAILLLLSLMPPALAHPHIFIDAKATVVFDAAGAVRGIRNQWMFDEAYSAWSIQGLDTNNDGVTSTEELQPLANDNMNGLADYEYYTFAGEGPDNLKFTHGKNPKISYEAGRTTLSFEVDLDQPYLIKDALEIAINDPEYYVAISFAGARSVTLENAPKNCAVEIEPGHEMPPALADELYALPSDVTEIPPALADALRGVQGAIVVKCGGGSTTGIAGPAAPDTTLDAITQLSSIKPIPFGGPPKEAGIAMPRTGLLGWVMEQQKKFYQALTAALAALKTDSNGFWILGGLSFLYGIFHAAGPGHGKVVISSYVLANEQQMRRGIVLSFLSAMLASAVAVGFVLIAALALNLTSLAMSDAANWIGILSYGLVMLLGLWLIGRKIFGFGHSHRLQTRGASDLAVRARAHLHEGHMHHHDDGHNGHDGHDGHDGHGHERGHDHAPHVVSADQVAGNWREQLGVIIAVGMRPCSGALVVLVFALSQGLLLAGIGAVFLMGLGTAITVGVLAALAVTAKELAWRILGTEGRFATGLVWWAELLGAAAVFGLGLLLLLATVFG